MTDLSKFHYYERPPEFTANIKVTGTASLSIKAASREDAKEKINAMIDAAFASEGILDLIELDDAHDVEIGYVSASPTRMYLLTRPGGRDITGSSHVDPGDEPRPPTADDQEMADRFGYAVSWTPEDVVQVGGAQ